MPLLNIVFIVGPHGMGHSKLPNRPRCSRHEPQSVNLQGTRMSETQISRPRISLFDSDGLPWTARLSMAWLVWIFALTGGLAAIPIGLYIGIWIRAKTRSTIVLIVYALLAGACILAFVPDSILPPRWSDPTALAILLLWFAGALIGRRQISRYYLQREGAEFDLSLAYTLLFGAWYLNYRIRPEYSHGLRTKPSS